MRRFHSRLLLLPLTVIGLFISYTGPTLAQDRPVLIAVSETLPGLRSADANFPVDAAALAGAIESQKPQNLEELVRLANATAISFKPEAAAAWMKAFSDVLVRSRNNQLAPPPANLPEEVVKLLRAAAQEHAQSSIGEFATAAAPVDDEVVKQLADKLVASEVFRRDVRFADTAKGLIAELARMQQLVGTKYQPAADGQPFATEVIQQLEANVIAKVEGDRLKDEWRKTYNAFVQDVKNQKYGPFHGTVADWKVMIDRVVRAVGSVVKVDASLPQNPLVQGGAAGSGAAAVGTTTGGTWYSHAALHHERVMSRIYGRNEVRPLRVQRYRGN